MNPENNLPQSSEHGKHVAAMFGRISPFYDLLNRVLSLGLDIYWRKELVRKIPQLSTKRIVDLAAGTMDVCREINKNLPKSSILAFDFSLPMLRKGKRKVSDSSLLPVCCDALSIPLPDESVDCVTIAFGIRNIRPRNLAYQEINRILIPGGRLCILEFGTGQDRVWGGFYNFYLKRVLPLVGKTVSRDQEAYKYLARTINSFPSAELLRQELLDDQFSQVDYKKLTSGIVYLHWADKKT